MAPGEDCPTSAKNQPPAKILWRQHRARRPRRRVCLLKGCGRAFRPQQPMARYCSEACQAEARWWRQWKARRRYRQSPNGKRKKALPSPPRGSSLQMFFRARVIARDATRSSTAPGDRPCNGSVPVPAVVKRDTKSLSEKCLRLNSHTKCGTNTPAQWIPVVFSVGLEPRREGTRRVVATA
jgi:hypothetical protein